MEKEKSSKSKIMSLKIVIERKENYYLMKKKIYKMKRKPQKGGCVCVCAEIENI